eukprot:TRINITY_DN3468_c0_g1_i1.p1 TRINITY_DN3468_c0_g1~~TRINITY_DN3468_c0_g1_i1.p1  ORF type:complete len:310 (-),score=59.47 TRINITY_DN3468_c0_g1_i1:46-942(-)
MENELVPAAAVEVTAAIDALVHPGGELTAPELVLFAAKTVAAEDAQNDIKKKLTTSGTRTPRRRGRKGEDGEDEKRVIPEPTIPKKDTELTRETLGKPVFEGIDAFTLYWLLEKATCKWGTLKSIGFSTVNQFIHSGMRKNSFGINWIKKTIASTIDEMGEDTLFEFADENGEVVHMKPNDTYPSFFRVTEKGRALGSTFWPREVRYPGDEDNTPRKRRRRSAGMRNSAGGQDETSSEDETEQGPNPLWGEVSKMHAVLEDQKKIFEELQSKYNALEADNRRLMSENADLKAMVGVKE